jgi:adenylyl-sulfate kinase
MIVWIMGLPASGKTTLTTAVGRALIAAGHQVIVLDGDEFRRGVGSDLGYTPDERRENLRRAVETACLLANQGVFVLAAFITPRENDRAFIADTVRRRAPETGLLRVFLDAPVSACEARDPKGHYLRARRGEIANFTGVSAPFERPITTDVYIDTAATTPAQATSLLLQALTRVLSEAPRGAIAG